MTTSMCTVPADVDAAAALLLSDAPELLVVTDRVERAPGEDAAIGSALLDEVIARPGTPWLRLYRTAPTVGFSGRDLLVPGLPAAVDAARRHGFAPVRRSPGGRAAAYHRQTLCFDLVVPAGVGSPESRCQIAALSVLLLPTLTGFGVDARIGPVPDEYCPGEFSINRGGMEKIVGTAARRRHGATLISGLCPVGDPEPLRAVVVDVYAALGIPCDPVTVGSMAVDEDPLAVGTAFARDLAAFLPVRAAELPDGVVRTARTAPADLV